jgi:hypothetical protein
MTTPNRESGSQIRELKQQVVGQTKQALSQARDRAGSSLGESDQAEGLASAFRRTAEQLREEDRTTVAGLTEAVARQADQAATYLRQADVRAAREDFERLARRRPTLVLGGALALGLVAARFLKSSKRGRASSGRTGRSQDYSAPGPLYSPAGPPPQEPRVGPGDPYAGA